MMKNFFRFGLALLLATFVGLSESNADAPPGLIAHEAAIYAKLKAEVAEGVASWHKDRKTMIDTLVARGASSQEAGEAIDELIAQGDAQVKAGESFLRPTAPKLSALEGKLSIIQGISNIGHDRFKAFAAAHGLAPSKDFYDCLCPPSFWYAPSAHGPCEGRTIAYGTVIYSNLSTDPAVWANCAAAENASGRPLVDTIVSKVHAIQKRYIYNVCSRLVTILEATKSMKKAGKLRPPAESFLATSDMEKTFFDSLLGRPVSGVTEDILSGFSDKVAIRTGLADPKSPTGLGVFLTDSAQPSETGLKNPYVRTTKATTGAATVNQTGRLVKMSFEMALARRIIRSRGSLSPGDVFRMAVEVTKGDVPLAALVAHNLLKEAAYGRRRHKPMILATIGKRLGTGKQYPEQRAIRKAYADAFDNKGNFQGINFIADPEIIRSKLQDIRPVYDSQIDDRLGPWYHTFGLIFVGTNPAVGEGAANLGALTETVTRFLNLGSGRSPGKEAANICGARLVSLMNRNMELSPKP